MNKDTVAGSIKETGGKIRKEIGKITGDTESQARGAADEVSGNIQKNVGKFKDAISE